MKNATAPHQIRIYFLPCNLIAYFILVFCILWAFLINQLVRLRLLTHLVGYLPSHIQCALKFDLMEGARDAIGLKINGLDM